MQFSCSALLWSVIEWMHYWKERVSLKARCNGKNTGLKIGQNLDLNSGLSTVSGAIATDFSPRLVMIKKQTSFTFGI